MGINYEQFAARVNSYAYASKDQEEIYRRLYQHSVRLNANIPKILADS